MMFIDNVSLQNKNQFLFAWDSWNFSQTKCTGAKRDFGEQSTSVLSCHHCTFSAKISLQENDIDMWLWFKRFIAYSNRSMILKCNTESDREHYLSIIQW